MTGVYAPTPGQSSIPGFAVPGYSIPGTTYKITPQTTPVQIPHMSLSVYDTDMVRVGEVALYESLTYTENWYSPDTWELKINRYLPNATTLTPTGYIGIVRDDITRIGRIERFAPALDKDGKSTETWTLSGRSAFGGKLKKRVAIPQFSVSTNSGYDKLNHTTYETAARHLVEINAIAALGPDGLADASRDIPGITLETSDRCRGDIASAAVVKALQYHSGTYTDITAACNDITVDDIPLPPVSAVNDALYIGDTSKFHRLLVNLGTAGIYFGTLVWEYYNGSAWVVIPGLTDDTEGFTAVAGDEYDIYWIVPADWAQVAVNGTTQYWIRARCSAFTSVTTAPLGTQIWCGLKLQTRAENLISLLETWSKTSGLHFDLEWSGSGNNFTFRTTEGTDRTGAGTAGKVTLSVDLCNVLAYAYVYSILDAAETLYCGGSGDGSSRLLSEVYDDTDRPAGEDRNEAFVDLTDCTTAATLAAKGREQLENYRPVQSLTFDYNPASTSYVINRDFFCGDFIIVDFPGVATMTSRITSVEYVREASGYSVKITVGTERPDMTSIVKKIQNSTSAIRRK